ncbi:MAG: ATP-binding protein [Butyrivibrio sp.]|nr:ATP-binding protein [Butyrivibrio sp.]
MDEYQTRELRYLNKLYERGESTILVVYCNRYVSAGTVISTFCQDKNYMFYRARSASERVQLHLWATELRARGVSISDYPDFKEFNQVMNGFRDKPMVMIIDHFEKFVRSSDSFIRSLGSFVYDDQRPPVMVILTSQANEWVENSMVDVLGEQAQLIRGILKLRESDFKVMREYFPKMSYTDAVQSFALMGGKSSLWHFFDGTKSFKENLCEQYLNRESYLYQIPLHIVRENLRETAVYNTILYELASGHTKLNDLHHATGYARAKIMVYIKNLIGLEIVEKVYSFSSSGRENVQKGVYRISDPMVHFYFRFIYPYQSNLQLMSAEKYYDLFISAGLPVYVESYFRQICRQFLLRCDEQGRLPIRIEEEGEWVGKLGSIDIVAQSETGETILGSCSWRNKMTKEDFEWLINCSRKARLNGDYFYLFSGVGFTDELIELSETDSRILLLGPDELQV